MKSSLIILGSYTEAMKATRFLRRNEIIARVERTSGKDGCVFGLRTNENPTYICRLLSGIGISCRSDRERGR